MKKKLSDITLPDAKKLKKINGSSLSQFFPYVPNGLPDIPKSLQLLSNTKKKFTLQLSSQNTKLSNNKNNNKKKIIQSSSQIITKKQLSNNNNKNNYNKNKKQIDISLLTNILKQASKHYLLKMKNSRYITSIYITVNNI